MKLADAIEADSIAGQYSGPTLNPAGLPAPSIARTTKDWKPAGQGPPKIEVKTAVLSVDSNGHKTSELSLQSKMEGDAVAFRLKGPKGVVASAVLAPRDKEEGFTVEKLEVPSEHRGQGHARTMLKELKQWTAEPLFIRPRPYGDMPADIEALKKLYSSEGFEVIDGKDTMKLKTAAWNPREIPPQEKNRQAPAGPALTSKKMLLASLMASKLLGGNPKLAAVALEGFRDELTKLR